MCILKEPGFEVWRHSCPLYLLCPWSDVTVNEGKETSVYASNPNQRQWRLSGLSGQAHTYIHIYLHSGPGVASTPVKLESCTLANGALGSEAPFKPSTSGSLAPALVANLVGQP